MSHLTLEDIRKSLCKASCTVLLRILKLEFSKLTFKIYRADWVSLVLDKDDDMAGKGKLLYSSFAYSGSGPIHCMELVIWLVMYSTYFGSVILRISLQSRPINVTDSSTGLNFGIGIWVDWYMLCQSWIWKISFRVFAVLALHIFNLPYEFYWFCLT